MLFSNYWRYLVIIIQDASETSYILKSIYCSLLIGLVSVFLGIKKAFLIQFRIAIVMFFFHLYFCKKKLTT